MEIEEFFQELAKTKTGEKKWIVLPPFGLIRQLETDRICSTTCPIAAVANLHNSAGRYTSGGFVEASLFLNLSRELRQEIVEASDGTPRGNKALRRRILDTLELEDL